MEGLGRNGRGGMEVSEVGVRVWSGCEGCKYRTGKEQNTEGNQNGRKIVCVCVCGCMRVCVCMSKNLCSVYVLAPPIKNTDVKQSFGKDLVWDGDGLFFLTLSL